YPSWTDRSLGPFNIKPYSLVYYRITGQFFTDYLLIGIALSYDMYNTTYNSLYSFPTHILIQQLFPITVPTRNNRIPIISIPINQVYPYRVDNLLSKQPIPSPESAIFSNAFHVCNKAIQSLVPDFITENIDNTSYFKIKNLSNWIKQLKDALKKLYFMYCQFGKFRVGIGSEVDED